MILMDVDGIAFIAGSQHFVSALPSTTSWQGVGISQTMAFSCEQARTNAVLHLLKHRPSDDACAQLNSANIEKGQDPRLSHPHSVPTYFI